MVCRFGGHCRRFYSVAEHSIRVSRLCPSGDALWGLLHDATEAYLGDLPSPLKRPASDLGVAYRVAELRLQRVILKRFRLDPRRPATVDRADALLLATEWRDLMGANPIPAGSPAPLAQHIRPMSASKAEAGYLERYRELAHPGSRRFPRLGSPGPAVARPGS
jgi:hypothetical protein